MEIKEKMKIKGTIHCVLYDENGNVKDVQEDHNTITELMDALVANRISGGSDALLTHAHAGTGSGQTSVDSNLDAYFAEARVTTSVVQGAGGADNDVIVTFTMGPTVCTGTIEEIGLFSSSNQATGDMKAYSDTISFAKGAGDTLVVTWTLTMGSS
jgi:hypothetical protein